VLGLPDHGEISETDDRSNSGGKNRPQKKKKIVSAYATRGCGGRAVVTGGRSRGPVHVPVSRKMRWEQSAGSDAPRDFAALSHLTGPAEFISEPASKNEGHSQPVGPPTLPQGPLAGRTEHIR